MKLLPNFLSKRPHVAEHDFAGMVVNGNGTRFSNGDEVFGCILSGIRSFYIRTDRAC